MCILSKVMENNDFIILKNENGMVVTLSNFGARIVGICVPDKENNPVNVVLGFESLEQYLTTPDPYYGATIGRYANRIKKGQFLIDGRKYQLPVNNGENHLHGGPNGFHAKLWNVDSVSDSSIVFSLVSVNEDEGYPGNVKVSVQYILSEQNELHILFRASTDEPTIINLTNHAFFNLNGEGSGLIDKHEIIIAADYFTPVDASLIPTGEIRPVDNTSFDFRTPKTIGLRIHFNDEQLTLGNGYDHNFILRNQKSEEPVFAASAIGDKSGIKLEVLTTEPGLQFYTGNFMLGRNMLRNGSLDEFRTAFCFETQHYPDSPNKVLFPNTLLQVGEEFYSKTIFRFSS